MPSFEADPDGSEVFADGEFVETRIVDLSAFTLAALSTAAQPELLAAVDTVREQVLGDKSDGTIYEQLW